MGMIYLGIFFYGTKIAREDPLEIIIIVVVINIVIIIIMVITFMFHLKYLVSTVPLVVTLFETQTGMIKKK